MCGAYARSLARRCQPLTAVLDQRLQHPAAHAPVAVGILDERIRSGCASHLATPSASQITLGTRGRAIPTRCRWTTSAYYNVCMKQKSTIPPDVSDLEAVVDGVLRASRALVAVAARSIAQVDDTVT